jgi:hypothetical protein
VDVETFSDDVAEVRKEVTAPVAAAAADEVVDPQPSDPQDKASPEFTKELEMTVQRGESPVQNAPLAETHEDLLEGQDPYPSIATFNESFGTSYRGELLSVCCERADAWFVPSKLLTLWYSSKIVDGTGEGASEQAPLPPNKTPRDSGKQPSTYSKKISSDSVPLGRINVETLRRNGLRTI